MRYEHLIVMSPGTVAVGSTKEQCSRCIQEVWVAPSTHKMKANNPEAKDAKNICDECFHDLYRGQTVRIQGPNTEQRAEMRELGVKI